MFLSSHMTWVQGYVHGALTLNSHNINSMFTPSGQFSLRGSFIKWNYHNLIWKFHRHGSAQKLH